MYANIPYTSYESNGLENSKTICLSVLSELHVVSEEILFEVTNKMEALSQFAPENRPS